MDVYATDGSVHDGDFQLSRARFWLERRFGPDESMYFQGRIDDGTVWNRFFVEFPGLFGTKMTFGRFWPDFEAPYNWYTGGVSDYALWSPMTERRMDGMWIQRNFALGTFHLLANRHTLHWMQTPGATSPAGPAPGFTAGSPAGALEIMLAANLEYSARVGFDFGVSYIFGDDASYINNNTGTDLLDQVLTAWAGLRFIWNNDINIGGIYYHQEIDWVQSGVDVSNDSAQAYRIIVDVKQSMLRFTSLWLAYDYMDGHYRVFNRDNDWTLNGSGYTAGTFRGLVNTHDMTTYRIGATQRWNDTWRTWVYFAFHEFDNGTTVSDGHQLGVGIDYQLNPNVGFGFSYVRSDISGDAGAPSIDDNVVRFRTRVTF